MPQSKAPKRTPGTVYTERSLLDYSVFPRDGYVLPSRCTAHAEQADGTSVVVEIEIGGGRARAREVRVRTDKEAGIGWTVLSRCRSATSWRRRCSTA